MDLSGDTVKAVWGFNGTERPSAVYLAAVMAAFAQRGLPAFTMYSHDVQDIGGHVGADLIMLCSMLRIPVTMHNVPEEKVYRPHAWASFGTEDAQAADYAACKKYGPRYR